jgi:hypothetical protein
MSNDREHFRLIKQPGYVAWPPRLKKKKNLKSKKRFYFLFFLFIEI